MEHGQSPEGSSMPTVQGHDHEKSKSRDTWAEFASAPNYFHIQQSSKKKLQLLTEPELEVLKQIVIGMPNKTTARRLHVSIKTVEKRRSSIMKKLQVHSLPDLMRLWLQANPHELGLSTQPGPSIP